MLLPPPAAELPLVAPCGEGVHLPAPGTEGLLRDGARRPALLAFEAAEEDRAEPGRSGPARCGPGAVRVCASAPCGATQASWGACAPTRRPASASRRSAAGGPQGHLQTWAALPPIRTGAPPCRRALRTPGQRPGVLRGAHALRAREGPQVGFAKAGGGPTAGRARSSLGECPASFGPGEQMPGGHSLAGPNPCRWPG